MNVRLSISSFIKRLNEDNLVVTQRKDILQIMLTVLYLTLLSANIYSLLSRHVNLIAMRVSYKGETFVSEQIKLSCY
jgi:hypothetical protein